MDMIYLLHLLAALPIRFTIPIAILIIAFFTVRWLKQGWRHPDDTPESSEGGERDSDFV